MFLIRSKSFSGVLNRKSDDPLTNSKRNTLPKAFSAKPLTTFFKKQSCMSAVDPERTPFISGNHQVVSETTSEHETHVTFDYNRIIQNPSGGIPTTRSDAYKNSSANHSYWKVVTSSSEEDSVYYNCLSTGYTVSSSSDYSLDDTYTPNSGQDFTLRSPTKINFETMKIHEGFFPNGGKENDKIK